MEIQAMHTWESEIVTKMIMEFFFFFDGEKFINWVSHKML